MAMSFRLLVEVRIISGGSDYQLSHHDVFCFLLDDQCVHTQKQTTMHTYNRHIHIDMYTHIGTNTFRQMYTH